MCRLFETQRDLGKPQLKYRLRHYFKGKEELGGVPVAPVIGAEEYDSRLLSNVNVFDGKDILTTGLYTGFLFWSFENGKSIAPDFSGLEQKMVFEACKRAWTRDAEEKRRAEILNLEQHRLEMLNKLLEQERQRLLKRRDPNIPTQTSPTKPHMKSKEFVLRLKNEIVQLTVEICNQLRFNEKFIDGTRIEQLDGPQALKEYDTRWQGAQDAYRILYLLQHPENADAGWNKLAKEWIETPENRDTIERNAPTLFWLNRHYGPLLNYFVDFSSMEELPFLARACPRAYNLIEFLEYYDWLATQGYRVATEIIEKPEYRFLDVRKRAETVALEMEEGFKSPEKTSDWEGISSRIKNKLYFLLDKIAGLNPFQSEAQHRAYFIPNREYHDGYYMAKLRRLQNSYTKALNSLITIWENDKEDNIGERGPLAPIEEKKHQPKIEEAVRTLQGLRNLSTDWKKWPRWEQNRFVEWEQWQNHEWCRVLCNNHFADPIEKGSARDCLNKIPELEKKFRITVNTAHDFTRLLSEAQDYIRLQYLTYLNKTNVQKNIFNLKCEDYISSDMIDQDRNLTSLGAWMMGKYEAEPVHFIRRMERLAWYFYEKEKEKDKKDKITLNGVNTNLHPWQYYIKGLMEHPNFINDMKRVGKTEEQNKKIDENWPLIKELWDYRYPDYPLPTRDQIIDAA